MVYYLGFLQGACAPHPRKAPSSVKHGGGCNVLGMNGCHRCSHLCSVMMYLLIAAAE
uniref:Uncharacterized protein n=1 Tax=Anguilla anguilla TaxID=7936 RepID=A0A0E9XU86_ANGAN